MLIWDLFQKENWGLEGREPDSGLGNAHALQLSQDGRLLFVVNPGSNDISVFAVRESGLALLDRVSSGGKQPLSVAARRSLLYVLNAGNVGDTDNITGFHVSDEGKLSHLSKSTRPLSAAAIAPAQIQFSPDGDVLMVTEKSTNVIDTYTIDSIDREDGSVTLVRSFRVLWRDRSIHNAESIGAAGELGNSMLPRAPILQFPGPDASSVATRDS